METDKDCINREDGQLDDDSLASVWGGSKYRPIIKWIGKEIGKAAISEGVSRVFDALGNGSATTTGPFRGGVAGGGYGGGGTQSWQVYIG